MVVGEVEVGDVGKEVVVDESAELDRWVGVDDFEEEEEPTEIFWRGGAVSWTGVWGVEWLNKK